MMFVKYQTPVFFFKKNKTRRHASKSQQYKLLRILVDEKYKLEKKTTTITQPTNSLLHPQQPLLTALNSFAITFIDALQCVLRANF